MPPIRWIHTQFYTLVNDSRRCFTWLGAKKDESPQGVIAVGPAHLVSPPSSFKAKKSLYNNYSHIFPKTKEYYIYLLHAVEYIYIAHIMSLRLLSTRLI